jgi:hypothetical protein
MGKQIVFATETMIAFGSHVYLNSHNSDVLVVPVLADTLINRVVVGTYLMDLVASPP